MPLILWSADASPMSQFQSPVAIAQKTGAVVQDDEPLANLFALAAAISLALALGNLLPLPVLDGGRMLLTLFEWTCARRPGPAFERRMSIASLAAILGFSAVIATNDVARLLGLALF